MCFGIELTCPMEENIEKWHTTKTEKYREMVTEAKSNGWTFYSIVLEVGARGWVPPSFKAMAKMSFGPQELASLTDRVRVLVRKCSYVIWINRFNCDFQTWRLAEASRSAT